MSHVKNLLRDPASLAPGEAAASVRAGAYGLAAFALVLLLGAGVFAFVPVEPESPMFLVHASVRLALGSVVLGMARFIVATACALAMAQVIENSAFGQRIGNRGLVLAALLILAGLTFGAVQ